MNVACLTVIPKSIQLLGKIFTEQFAFSSGDGVVVIGLGRFGGAVAQSLMAADSRAQRLEDLMRLLCAPAIVGVAAENFRGEMLKQ